MKRLDEEDFAAGTPEARLADLVRCAPRFAPSPFGRQRVLARIMQPARRGLRLRFVPVAVVAVVVAAFAAAAVDRRIVVRSRDVHSDDPVVSTTVTPRAPSVTPTPIVAPAPRAIDPVASAPVVAPAPPRSVGVPGPSSPEAARPADAPPASRKTVASVDARRARGTSDDPAQVVEAIRVLRSHGDATRASALLDEYMASHPGSPLSEDALALAIEAADARHDFRAAGAYASRYLREFPTGRYRAVALEAQRRQNP